MIIVQRMAYGLWRWTYEGEQCGYYTTGDAALKCAWDICGRELPALIYTVAP